MAGFGLLLLVSSLLGAMVAFRIIIARYLYALGREGALPARLGITSTSSAAGGGVGGVPRTGSVVQSGLALVGIVGFAIVGADPVAVMFTWLSTISAIGVLALMTAASLAVIGHYHRRARRSRGHDPHRAGGQGRWRPPRPGWWARAVAPTLAAVGLAGVFSVTTSNLGSAVADPTARAVLPGVIGLAAAVGGLWAQWLRARRPAVWATVGRGQPAPLAVLAPAVKHLTL